MLIELQAKAYGRLTFRLGGDFPYSYENVQDALTHPRRHSIANSQIYWWNSAAPVSRSLQNRISTRSPGRYGSNHYT
jgi:hypothetical protein